MVTTEIVGAIIGAPLGLFVVVRIVQPIMDYLDHLSYKAFHLDPPFSAAPQPKVQNPDEQQNHEKLLSG
jgi:hypothetical protein